MDWVTVGKVVLAAGQAFKKYLDDQAAEEAKRRDREELIAAIKTLTDDVIDTFVTQRIVELKGDLEGFQDVYHSYDPGSPAEEERLRSLIDESARVLGVLGQGLDVRPVQEELAFETHAIYVPLLFLRAQAMIERERTYGEEEVADIIPSFNLAIPRLRNLLEYLRAKSDAEFSDVICKPIADSQDHGVCFFKQRGAQFICGSLRDPNGLAKCRRMRERIMEGAYLNSESVGQIGGAVTALETSRQAILSGNVIRLMARQ